MIASTSKQPAKLSSEFIEQLEQVESAYWMKYYRGDAILPVYSSVIAGALVCATPDLDILAMNRVIGLGTSKTLNEETLEQVVQFYERAGTSRFFIQLPPALVNEDTRNLLLRYGFAHHNNWTKLYREVQPMVVPMTRALSVRRIDVQEADNYGQLIFLSFDWEDTRLASWLGSTVGQAGYRHYIVSCEGVDIAAGALFVDGPMASMAFAGTLAPFRGRGAQSLLLKTRLQDAFDLGARFITSETAQHSEERPVQSYLNMIRAGFEVAYQRQNWIYQF